MNKALMKNLVSGAAGGIVGSWLMSTLVTLYRPALTPQTGKKPQSPEDKKDAAVAVANDIAQIVLKRRLDEREKRLGGKLVHYGFGVSTGIAYGALAHLNPKCTLGFGSLYGAGIWLAADEMALPLMGLTAPPNRIPSRRHAVMFGLHIAYGLALEATRRAVVGRAHSRQESIRDSA